MTQRTSALHSPADFGLAIREARLDRGLSQAQLAEILDLPQSTISEIEGGKSTIYLRRLLTLARATGISFTANWEGDDEARG